MSAFSKLMHMVTKSSSLAAVLLLSFATAARPETIVSSLNNTSTPVAFIFGNWGASPFTTDAQPWTLTSASVTLQLASTGAVPTNVRLMADAAGQPGATLADLGMRTVTAGSQLYTFAAPGSVTLQPSTTYWIAVGNVSTNGTINLPLSDWGATFTNSGVPGASMAKSIAAGAGVDGNPPTNWIPTSGVALLFSVEGTRQGGGGPGPLLMMSFINQQVYATWATNFTGYTLQWATSLPSTNWTTLPGQPTIIGSEFAQRIDDTNAPLRYFRLHRP